MVDLYETTLVAARGRGLPLRAGPAALVRAHAGCLRPLRILFTTSNGTGLGHLTRSMAIARRLDDDVEPLFLTLSAAAPVVEGMGFPVEYVASYATPGSGNDYRWSRRLRGRLRAAIAEADPDLIVFDGTHPYEALLGALPASRHRGLVPAAALEARLEPGAAGPRRRLRRRARAGRAGRVRGRAARPSRCATAPTASGRSSSSTARSCSTRAEAAAEFGLEPGTHERARQPRPGGGGPRGDRARPRPPRRARRRPGRGAPRRSGARRRRTGPRGRRRAARDLPDEPLLRRVRRRGRGRRLQRLPRADRARRARRCSCRCAARPTTSRRGRRYAEARGLGFGRERARRTPGSRQSSSGCSTPEREPRSPPASATLEPADGAAAGPRRGWPSLDRRRRGAFAAVVVEGRASRAGGSSGAGGVVLRQPAAHRGTAGSAPAAHPAAGAGARPRDRGRAATSSRRCGRRCATGGQPAEPRPRGHRRARGARRAAGARRRGRAPAGPRVAPGGARRRRLRGVPRRPPGADPRRAPQAAPNRRGPGGSLRYPEGASMEASTPVKSLDQAASGADSRTAGALPNLIVIGAQKCGTSVLHYYLEPPSRGLDVEARRSSTSSSRSATGRAGSTGTAPTSTPRRASAARRRPTTRPSRSTRASPSGWRRSCPTRS